MVPGQQTMGRFGLAEIIVIALVAFILIQPKDLFGVIRKAGKAWQKMKSMRDEFVQGIRDVETTMTRMPGGGSEAAPGAPPSHGQRPRDAEPGS